MLVQVVLAASDLEALRDQLGEVAGAAHARAEARIVVAPAGAPAAIVQRLHTEFAKALAAPDVRERIAGLGGEIAATPPADTERWLATQLDKWAQVVRTSNIKID